MCIWLCVNLVEMDWKICYVWLEKVFFFVLDLCVFVFNEVVVKFVILLFDIEGYLYVNCMFVCMMGSIGVDVLDCVEGIYDDMFWCIWMCDNWVVLIELGFCFDGGIVIGLFIYFEEVR